ncbi:MAG: N-acetylmuramoyl-L-alanine amidase [Pseudomonadota bacterium]|nr:N-acetylmuramoyl-L-alanine amidase [Pseudomonadota bacterium]
MLRFCLSLILLLISSNAWSANIQAMRLSQAGSETRLVIDLDKAFQYEVFSLANPARLVVDIKNTLQTSQLRFPDLLNSPIRAIRYASWQDNTLRLVFDLHHKVRYDSRTLGPKADYLHRLVIDLHDSPNAPTMQSVLASERQPVAAPAPALRQTEISPKPAEITRPTPLATVSKSKKYMVRRDIIIAIDPGHGGLDSGALGRHGTKEKDIVLAVAKRLAKMVNAEPGMRAYLTRDTDVFITLRQRIKRARENKADMFISIHADAFKDAKAKGASVFVLSQRGASSEAAQMMADKENAADLAGGISLEDKDDMLASVLLDLSQTASLEASLEVANTVLAGLKRVGNVHKKHVESAAFVVLKSPDIPSILVETAFVSNPDEERKLNTPSHQNKIARAILSGISNYFQRNPLPGSGSPQQHIVSSGDTLSMIAQRYQISMLELKTSNNLNRSDINVGDVLLIP